ncbi:Paf1-domain-containing protein [Bimuria novae-zelandiae CBS 107.79]|uniref:Paf1-domain-containing protein n=1 Tax=Bimuria novae-zelandiae CBS 107.79 TaxID=1447943 RepID=A0A6A5VEQ0_9PLEO|nr:Paf1-domain-containing protein [Bimuria novae-zelandiae CBS 107.79]
MSRSQAYQQDYIARIRFSNALPPPPCPPKLLDIPNTGLANGDYTSAQFASRLAREQPLNIEADAELGMPIDLVGIPGVFDGDESAIQALPNPPQLHPADRALMRPPNALGKSTASASNAAFLRRTEYITSSTAGSKVTFESSNSSNTMRLQKKRARGNVHEDDPIYITRNILKGFNLAYPEDAYTGPDTTENLRPAEIGVEEKRAWKTPKHPRNEKLQLVGSYPLLPDFDAIPDTGSYAMFKFGAAPVKDASNPSEYDSRLDVSILRLAGETIEDREKFLQEHELYKQDPSMHPPLPWFHYEFFLPSDHSKVAGIKRNFTTNDPDAPDLPFDETVDDDGRPRKFFRYENIRTYETQSQVSNLNDRFGDTVALALHDPDIHKAERLRDTELQKAAYFYPIGQKSHIRTRRPGRVQMVEEFPKIDYLDASGREPDEEEKSKREAERRQYDLVDV